MAPAEPMANLPAAAREAMARIGPVWGEDIQKHRGIVLATYAPLLASIGKLRCERDLPYGSHPRHRLDVFHPGTGSSAPVVLFVHGGAFIRGSKSSSAGIYDNVPQWFASQGCVGINVEYRLAPEAAFPSGAQDVAAAVAWAKAHSAEYGGDPSRMYLVGHSAGATHIATYVLDPNVAAKPGKEVAGIVLISGRLRVDALPENPNAGGVRAYFGDDESQYEARSPVTYAHLCDRPVMIAIAEFENPLLDLYGAEFMWRVASARRKAPRFLRMRRHNHSSMVMHFNSGEEILGREIMSFMAEGR